MKLSLSGRIIEVDYKYCQVNVDEFCKLAKDNGYDAVELRATQINAETTPEQVRQFRSALDRHGIGVSRLPGGSVEENGSLEGLEKFADMAVELGCPYLSVRFDTIASAQKAADCLKERDLSIAIQTHTGGLFETPEISLDTLKKIDRDNFGVMYDPANFFIMRADYVKGIEPLRDYLFLFSVQCIGRADTPEDDDDELFDGAYYPRRLLDAPDAMDFGGAIEALGNIGFDGYITVIEPISPIMSNLELAGYMSRSLKKMMPKTA